MQASGIFPDLLFSLPLYSHLPVSSVANFSTGIRGIIIFFTIAILIASTQATSWGNLFASFLLLRLPLPLPHLLPLSSVPPPSPPVCSPHSSSHISYLGPAAYSNPVLTGSQGVADPFVLKYNGMIILVVTFLFYYLY